MRESTKKRLAVLEAARLPGESWVLAEAEDGTREELLVEDWFARRHELKFLKFTRGFDPTYHDIDLLNAAIDEEVQNELYEEAD